MSHGEVNLSVEAALRGVAFFQDLSDEQIAWLGRVGRVETVSSGLPVFRAGDTASSLFVILSGAVRVFIPDGRERTIELREAGPGEIFGELALLDGSTRSASISTVRPSRFFSLDRHAFLELLSRSPEFLSRLFKSMSNRTRELTESALREEIASRELKASMQVERYRTLAHVVAGLAHELGTPLGMVNTTAAFLLDHFRRPEIKALLEQGGAGEVLSDMTEAASLMSTHVLRAHDLVQSFKRLSVGELLDEPETMNISETVAEIVGLHRLSARQARLGVVIRDRLSPGARTWFGSRGHLSQVLLNLLTNIERYAYPAGAGGRVEIDLSMEGDTDFRLVVQDFGAGIPPENLDKVFLPLFTTGRRVGGTGLGLSIVHNTVTGPMHGRIEIQSRPGDGTSIILHLPRSVSEPARREDSYPPGSI